MNCQHALLLDELEDVLDPELLEWHPTPRAPQPPDSELLSEAHERSLRWNPSDWNDRELKELLERREEQARARSVHRGHSADA